MALPLKTITIRSHVDASLLAKGFRLRPPPFVLTVIAGFVAAIVQLAIRHFALGPTHQHFVQVAIAAVLAAAGGIIIVATMEGLTFDSLNDWLAAAGIAFGASQALYAVVLKLIQESNPPPA